MPLIDEREALRLLRVRVDRAGGVRAYARKLDCQPSFVSGMLNRHSYITGVVAEDVGVRSVHHYEFIGPKKSPEQERYENQRIAHRERNPLVSKEVIEETEKMIAERERQAKAREAEARLLGEAGAPKTSSYTSQDQSSEK